MATPRDPVAGALAAAVALGTSELVAGLRAGLPSLVEGVGNRVIDWAPPALKDFAIETFGTADKPVLLASVTVVVVAIGALVGTVGRRRWGIAVGAFVGAAALGAWAAAADPGVSPALAVVPGGAAALVGLGALRAMYGGETKFDPGRRRFLRVAGGVAVVAVVGAVAGRLLIERSKRAFSGRDAVALPAPVSPLPGPPAGADLGISGLTPIHVPNRDFYRIDTALFVPRVDAAEWRLEVTGRVARPFRITYEDLLEMPMIERDVTLVCVSNRVGGDLVGNARWLGVPLLDLLDRAGVDPDGEQVVGRSVDGFTAGFPYEVLADGRDALVAVGMNGEPLPYEHGYPARLVVAGLYGYVSATKWLEQIELTGWDSFDGYWVPRGWAKEAPVKTQSRIDVPARRARLEPGPTKVAGVAWAPGRGIERVEVQIGEGAPWIEARLSVPLSASAWVQWEVPWDARAGEYLVTVRATDGDSVLQDQRVRTPAPDGATGWHTVRVVVG
jgi:DMSO/TMAO reductase YedYZ molybdopterin-dependent catalytic subunit